MRNQVILDERLDIIFVEVENVVNNRPLTPVSEDLTDLCIWIPNDFLGPGQRFTESLEEFDRLETYRKRWRHTVPSK